MNDKLSTNDMTGTRRTDEPRQVTNRRRFVLCTGRVVYAQEAYQFPEAHILGDLRNMTLEGRSVPSLALWLTPVDNLHVPPLHPEIVAYIIAEARLIRCRFEGCRRVMRWDTSREVMEALRERWEEE